MSIDSVLKNEFLLYVSQFKTCFTSGEIDLQNAKLSDFSAQKIQIL